MTLLDGILIIVTLISAVLAMIRGFAREILSIAAWVAAAAVAYFFYDDLLPVVADYIENETIADVVTIGALFLVTLILVSLVTLRLSDIILDSRVGPIDRLLGLIFGAARGVLLVAVALVFFNWFVPEDAPDRPTFVSDAYSYEFLNTIGDELRKLLPEDEEATDGTEEGAVSLDDVLPTGP